MSKSRDIQELTGLLSQSLRHKIGSIVNKQELYATQYAKNAATILKRAAVVSKRHTWNRDEKAEIRTMLYNKLYNELKQKTFLHERKFEMIDDEIDKALKEIL
ncbi:hypothetical protein HYU06_04095 [Candidatus Woesearchaeota archaeon]|nr:hypothetical protein [Candidatus Woesearchaeota archaeon]